MSFEIVPIISRAAEDLLSICPGKIELILLRGTGNVQVEIRWVHAASNHVRRCIVGNETKEGVASVQSSDKKALNVFARIPNESSPKRIN